MLRRFALVRTDASNECIAFIKIMTRIGEQGTELAVIPVCLSQGFATA
jgi:hypothetical protein